MDFTHTEDRRMLADTLTRFVSDKYAIERRNEDAFSEIGYNKAIWSELADLGVFAALFAEAQGGFGGTGFDISVVFEYLGKGLITEPILESAVLAGGVVAKSASADHKTLLAEIMTGNKAATLAHYEPTSRYALNDVQLAATPNADGWLLSGRKVVVKGAEAADYIVVSARISGARYDEHGIALFLLPRNMAGLHVRGYNTVAGGRAAELILENVKLPEAALLLDGGKGFAALEEAIGAGVLALCAESLGIMDVVRLETQAYLQTRSQFGTAIGKFQALQHRMVDMYTSIEEARSAVINAAAAFDLPDKVKRERALSAAKYTIGRVGHNVAEEAIQLHGGMGMTWELPLSHFAKRLIMIDHELGDEDYHLVRYIELGKSL